MALSDWAEKLPESEREQFHAEIASYIPTKDIERNPEFQRQLSIKHDTTMAHWQRDKLPELIENEIKKRTTKSPEALEIEALRAEMAEARRQAVLKDRKAQAVAELARLELDTDLADFIIHEDEEKFKGNLDLLSGKLKSWRDEQEKKLKTSVFGQKAPPAGQSGSVDFGKMTVTEVMNYAKQSPENLQAVTEWQKNKKGA